MELFKGGLFMKVSYHAHSVVKVEANGKTILIDPFSQGIENCDLKWKV